MKDGLYCFCFSMCRTFAAVRTVTAFYGDLGDMLRNRGSKTRRHSRQRQDSLSLGASYRTSAMGSERATYGFIVRQFSVILCQIDQTWPAWRGRAEDENKPFQDNRVCACDYLPVARRHDVASECATHPG